MIFQNSRYFALKMELKLSKMLFSVKYVLLRYQNLQFYVVWFFLVENFIFLYSTHQIFLYSTHQTNIKDFVKI